MLNPDSNTQYPSNTFLATPVHTLLLLILLLLRQAVMLIDIRRLPRVADPLIAACLRSKIPPLHNILRENTLLGLILVMQHEDAKARLLALTAELLLRLDDVLLELLDGVLERGSRVIDLVNDEDVLADQVRHLEGGEVEPLCAGDFRAGLLDGVGAEGFVEGETDGLDGDVGGAGLLQEGSARASVLLRGRGGWREWAHRRMRAGT